MGIFVCDKCDCMENTTQGQYWDKDYPGQYPPEYQGKALCSECASPTFADGTSTGIGRCWHGKWPKVKWDGIRPVLNR